MSLRKGYGMFYAMLLLAAVCSVLYHTATKSLPELSHPFANLSVAYLVSAALSFLLLLIFQKGIDLGVAFAQLDWKSYALGAALVGVETGIYYLYRGGSTISATPLVLSAVQTVITMSIGIFILKEKIQLVNGVGIVMCLFGAYFAVK